MSCYLCSPPTNLLISGHWSTLMHEHHVKEFHLGPYKPFKCQVQNCNQSVTVAPFFPLHANAKHRFTEPVRHGSDYLESLTNVLMHYNYYSAGNGAHLACNLVKAIQTQLSHCENENGNPPEALDLSRDENPQSQAQPEGHEAPGKLPTSNAGSGRTKKGVACLFCTETLPSPSSVKLHEDRRHNLVSNGEYKCDKCSRRFHFLSHYRTHLCRLAGFVKEKQPGTEKAKQSVQNKQKKKKSVMKLPKRNANFGNSSVSLHARKRYYYYCLKCKEKLAGHIIEHIAKTHIKKTLLRCNGCDYAICYWHPGNMRKHTAIVHNGNATFTDLRPNFTEELAEFKKKLIRRVHGGNVEPYLAKLKASTPNTLNYKGKTGSGGNRKVDDKSKYCTKCKISFTKRAVKIHLSGLSHIGKYCLHCKGCDFKTFWEPGKIMLHMKRKHPGAEVGFTDNRAEINEQIEIEEKLYIRDSQM